MQRQSLGSPAGKHLSPAASGADGDGDDRKKKRRTKTRVPEVEEAAGGEQHEAIPDRPVRRSSAAATERSIHLIPLLTLLCFFILYLCSHDPSTEDVAADLGGAGRLFDHAASTSTEIERYAAAGGVSAAAHGHRRLKELERLRGHHRRSRKLGRSAAA